VLLLHANLNLTYTVTESDWCGLAGLTDCESVNTSVPPDRTDLTVFFALAAFPESASPALKGVTFGLTYDPEKIYIISSGSCADFELAEPGWPAPDSGVALTWNTALQATLAELYWFAGYADPETDPAELSLVAHPTQGAAFADDSVPSILDDVADFGVLGFGSSGSSSCPASGESGGTGSPDGAGDEGGSEEQDGADGDSEDGSSETSPIDSYANLTDYAPEIEVQLAPDALNTPLLSSAELPIAEATFLVSDVRTPFAQLGALSVRRAIPTAVPGDTLAQDFAGRLVRITDLSPFYFLRFGSVEAAIAAQPFVVDVPYVQTASVVELLHIATPLTDDPKLYNHPGFPYDPQWHIENLGERSASTADADLRPETTYFGPGWPCDAVECPDKVTIGMVDTGLPDAHEDLDIIPLSAADRAGMHNNPNDPDYCGTHATKMSGIAGAITNNAKGIAGVCSSCRILDIESCFSSADCAANACSTIGSWQSRVPYAVSHFPELRVLLISGASSEEQEPGYSSPAKVLTLWNAFVMGILSVAPLRDTMFNNPAEVEPANIPFLIGVGGSTQEDLFWNEPSTCNSDPTLPLNTGTPVGPNAPDITAPACGPVVTTGPDSLTDYSYTGMFNSGAAAAVAGAAGHLFSADINYSNFGLGADDAMGILFNATRQYADDPTEGNDCGHCPKEYYGRGILDMGIMMSIYYEMFTGSFLVYTVRPDDAGVDWAPLYTFESNNFRRTWRLWRMRKTISLPRTNSVWPNVPEFVGWVNHTQTWWGEETTAPLIYGQIQSGTSDEAMTANADVVAIATNGPTSANMSVINAQTGQATLTAYTLEQVTEVSHQHISWVVAPEDLQVAYTTITRMHPASAELGSSESGRPIPSIITLGTPTSMSPRFRISGLDNSEHELQVHDVSGRLVWSTTVSGGGRGRAEILWDWTASSGVRPASGQYFVTVSGRDAKFSSRFTLLR